MSNYTCLVIDTGSGFTKSGLAIEDYECVKSPSIVGRGKGEDMNNLSYGSDALRRKEYLTITEPIQNGKITNFPDFEQYYEYLFTKKLKMKPSNFSLIQSYSLDETLKNKKKILELVFEKFDFPNYFGINHHNLCLYGYGIRNGIVVDSGYRNTRAVAFKDGNPIPYSIKSTNVGGFDVTTRMLDLVNSKKEVNINFDQARKMKEKFCFAANDYQVAIDEFMNKEENKRIYEMPDGTNIELREELFDSAEVLFQPWMKKSYEPGIHEIVPECLKELSKEEKKAISHFVCVSGGNFDMNNILKRFEVSLNQVAGTGFGFEFLQKEYNKQTIEWVGGTVISALTTFQQQWIDKDIYEEEGDSVVFRRCF